jgi:uncharacterized protein YndB with AHSA1/START domain
MSTTRLPLGQLLRDHERVGLRFERDFRHSPERVWRAITDSQDLRHWMPCDIVGPRESGAEIEARFWPAVVEKYPDLIEQPGLPGRILTWEPPTLFEWQWDTDLLRFELTPTATGTNLVFTTWIGATPGVEQTAAGYHICFDQLVGLVDEGRGGSVTDHDPDELEAVYRGAFED